MLKLLKLRKKQLAPVRDHGCWGRQRVSQRTLGRKVDYAGKRQKGTDDGSIKPITVEDSDAERVQMLLLLTLMRLRIRRRDC